MSEFNLQRLGVWMEPKPGNPQEIEGVLNSAIAGGRARGRRRAIGGTAKAKPTQAT
jgi:hypothetical protein